MAKTLDDARADPGGVVADLRRQLAVRTAERDQARAERDAAVEQQTATAEVLQIINSSPGDLAPVFDAILEKAHSLCGAALGSLGVFEGETWRAIVQRAYGEPLASKLRQPTRGSDNPLLQELIDGAPLVHVADLVQLDHPIGYANVAAGVRTLLVVALRKDRALLGTISIARHEPRPFSDKEIALLQNFSAQAVIAMENARLLTETREALEQQTATTEVLQVINSSPGDLAPVFQAIVEKAHTLCGAVCGSLQLWDGEKFRGLAMRGFTEAMVETLRQGYSPGSHHPCRELIDGGRIAHCADMAAVDDPVTRLGAKLSGIRTVAYVALRRDDALLGQIVAGRLEVRPFTDAELALLENFAAQAVIAMENARLINETREALEQQTATAEVLGVINSSPGNLTPVFDALLYKAMHLCGAAFGVLWTYHCEYIHAAAHYGLPLEAAEFFTSGPHPVSPNHARSRLMRGEAVVHVADVANTELYRSGDPLRRALVDLCGGRTLLVVPLRKDGAFLGDITIFRQEARPFSDKQIALLQNFAAQAVIAMENARLITETRKALEQQTATAEVLQVINSSPGDPAPVFDAMLDKALQLCSADYGVLWIRDGDVIRAGAIRGATEEFAHFLLRERVPVDADMLVARAVRERSVIHLRDAKDSEPYRRGVPLAVFSADRAGIRTILMVPLSKEDEGLGLLTIYRREVRLFSEKEIALVQNFAAQAVIAMENARLITETREALDQQTATAEVLQVINSSPSDLAPVFDAMLEKALRLCGAAFGALFNYDGESFSCAATCGFPPALLEYYREPVRPLPPRSAMAQLVAGKSTSQVTDIRADEFSSPTRRALADLGGARTMIWVALRKENALLGCIAIYRQQVRPFSEKEIALLENFAAQAVIAMENARLLTETREALEQQTATAEVLQVINSSPGDLAPVFDAILEKAHSLCSAPCGSLQVFDGEQFRAVAVRGLPEPFAAMLRQGYRPDQNAMRQQMLGPDRGVAQIADFRELLRSAPDDMVVRAGVEVARLGTVLFVPLLKDQALLGRIVAARQEVRPFSDKQIALLQNFAAQAVIAMENARLITETREALEQQTATAEILRVISGSPTDVQPTFDAIASNATTLSGAAAGMVFRFDGSLIHFVASHGLPPDLLQAMQRSFPCPPGRQSTTTRAIQTREVVHIANVAEDPEFVLTAIVQTGWHTALAVPILQDRNPVGAITVTRREVAPFSQAQIDLLKTFADQAVIAIENVRLFNELNARTRDLEESLEYQTATSDVLKVISRSTFDLQPVLDTLVGTAARLCEADLAVLANTEEDGYRVVATFSTSPEFEAFIRGHLLPKGRGSIAGRAALEGRVVQVANLAADSEYTVREAITLQNTGTTLGVPLLREGVAVGTITLGRQRVEPFTERQIELVRSFADQAVIAIENTRLLTELRESLEQQQAIAEVLGVINSSPGELQPVFDVILEKAHSLCGIASGSLELYDGETFRSVAEHGLPDDFARQLREGYPAAEHPATRSLIGGERFSHIVDIRQFDHPIFRAASERGFRTVLFVPLRREHALLGMIACARREVRAFSDKDIALLESFAAQAVIAMDNARLLNEIRQRQAELRVTFDNMGDGVAMFDGALRLAAWNQNFQQILSLPNEFLAGRPSLADYVRYLATHGEYGAVDIEAEVRRLVEAAGHQYSTERTRPDGRVIEVRVNPVPGGGIVLIYGDVTERKQAEAEIRAARDAAEKALGELHATQQQLVVQQKMAALGQLTAGIAHEIKNPLNFVNNFAGLSVELLDELKETAAPALATLDDGTRAEIDDTIAMLTSNLDKITEHGRRADGIVQSMLQHSRGGSGDWQEVDLNAMVDEALNLAYHGARAEDQSFNITMERDLDRALAPIEVVPQDVTRVFLNLIGNGFYAANKRSREAGDGFRPVLKVATRALRNAVEVRVRDNGTGIAPEHREKLFQPFFTTKPTGEGTGLGLSISHDIVTTQHGGTITVDSEVGEFTEFIVHLPRRRHGATSGRGDDRQHPERR